MFTLSAAAFFDFAAALFAYKQPCTFFAPLYDDSLFISLIIKVLLFLYGGFRLVILPHSSRFPLLAARRLCRVPPRRCVLAFQRFMRDYAGLHATFIVAFIIR